LAETASEPLWSRRSLLAESHLTGRLFGAMVRRIAALPVPAGQAEAVATEKSVNKELRDGEVRHESFGKEAVLTPGAMRRGGTGFFSAGRDPQGPRTGWDRPTQGGLVYAVS